MANYTAARVKHATLTAGQVDVVTLGQAYRQAEVINRSATDGIYITIDRGINNAQILTPSVAGDDCFYVGPGAVRSLTDDDFINAPVSVVRLISAGPAQYTVTGLNPIL